ncbi:SURF1 family protein [Novosphingobium sp.]|uniref:SURF1 family protein n=1 Tax=Novosphingobium sp. TaxID=1874826 RepID=UPI00286A8A76|nr:SURF1 family protein [Novosphingobium sp.]
MTLKRIPIIPTLLVLAAVGVMVRLGFWQLDRLHQKALLQQRYAAAQGMNADVPWPRTKADAEQLLFRHSRIDCRAPAADQPLSGRNAKGESGWSHMVACTLADGGKAEIVLGWSRDFAPRQWAGGAIGGIVAEGIAAPARLFVDAPLAGLEANARPDPKDLPNNHLSYAFQWFLFAATALVIYGLALRKRLSA